MNPFDIAEKQISQNPFDIAEQKVTDPFTIAEKSLRVATTEKIPSSLEELRRMEEEGALQEPWFNPAADFAVGGLMGKLGIGVAKKGVPALARTLKEGLGQATWGASDLLRGVTQKGVKAIEAPALEKTLRYTPREIQKSQLALPAAPASRVFVAGESPFPKVTPTWTEETGRKALPPSLPEERMAWERGKSPELQRQFAGETTGHVPLAPWESKPQTKILEPLGETTIANQPQKIKTITKKGKVKVIGLQKPSGLPGQGPPYLRETSLIKKPYMVEEQYDVTEKRLRNYEILTQTEPVSGKSRPLPPKQKQMAQQVEEMYNRADEKLGELRKRNWFPSLQALKRQLVDVSGNVKDELLKKGDLGKKAVIRHDLIAGSHSRAVNKIEEASKNIYSDLSPQEHKLLDRYIQSRRVVDIEQYKDIAHPEGLKLNDHKAYLYELKKNVDPDIYDKVEKRAQQYFAVARQQVKALLDNGLIDKTQYDNLIKHEYQPRKFIQYLDPEVEGYGGLTGQRKISVRDSGIQSLDEGSEQLLENDSELLLSQVISRTDARIARNKANQALHDLVVKVPDNGIVQLAPVTGKLPAGYDAVNVMKDGKPIKMMMPKNLAKEWVVNDPAVNQITAKTLQWVSGSKLLKPMATGLNPEFAVTNLPRDIAHAWMTTTEYSKHAPIAAGQMIKDFIKVAPDAFKKTGRFKDYVNEGGGMEFLTHMGGGGKLEANVSRLRRVLGYLGETSEIWTRLAWREKAMANGKVAEEATWIARNYLDFSQGGQFAKAVDNAIPYLNAGIQGTRGIFRAAKQNPKVFAYKSAQLGALASGLYLANTTVNKEAYDAISDKEKASSFIFTTPLSWKDAQGEKRWLYFRIPKDQGQRAITSLFESVVAKAKDGKIPSEQMISSMEDALPLMPETAISPTLSAIMSYRLNKDLWTKQELFKWPVPVKPKEEYFPDTNPAWVKIGQATGLSPERLAGASTKVFTYGNIYTSMVGKGLKEILDEMPEKERDKSMLEMINSIPFLRKFARTTYPQRYKEEREKKLERNTRRFEMRRKLWEQYK